MNKDKSIKDLKELNDKLKNQLEYSKFRICHLEMELKKHDNNWNELKKWLEEQLLMEIPMYGWTYKSMLNKINELEGDSNE